MYGKANDQKSILEYNIPPLLQAGALLATVVVFILGGRLISLTGWVDVDAGTPWLVACSFTLFYAIFNSVFSLSAKNPNNYWLHSLLGYLMVSVGGGLIAFLFSGHTMDEVGGYKVIYIVFTMGYILLLIIMRSMKRIVTFAEKQDGRLRGEDE